MSAEPFCLVYTYTSMCVRVFSLSLISISISLPLFLLISCRSKFRGASCPHLVSFIEGSKQPIACWDSTSRG